MEKYGHQTLQTDMVMKEESRKIVLALEFGTSILALGTFPYVLRSQFPQPIKKKVVKYDILLSSRSLSFFSLAPVMHFSMRI